MGLSESLFGWLHRSLRGKTTLPEHAVQFDAIEARLRALGALLGGRAVELREGEAYGGHGGHTLWLPPAIQFTQERAGNAAAYVYRLAYGVTALQRLGPPASGDAERDALAALLAVPALAAATHARWPGAQALARSLAPAAADWPSAKPRDERSRAAHALLRSVLGHQADVDPVPEVAQWVAAAQAATREPVDGERLDALLARFRRLRGHTSLAAVPLWLWGRPLPALMASPGGALEDAAALPSGTERQGRARQSVAEVRPEPTPSDSPLAHVFEKLLTAEEYQGGNKPLDGADEMAQHGDALDELDLRHLVRTRERAGSLLRADVAFASGGFEVAGEAPVEAALHYDEWDERHRAYRRQWCAVRVRRMGAPSAAAARAAAAARMRLRRQIRELRAQLARLDRSRAACLRQRDGEDIDIDAVVDHQATLASARAGAGCADEGRLYAARRRRSHEVAALLLIDGSLSTDAWIDGRRVLDVAREAVLVAGEAFGDLAIRIGIASFHSNTRRDCDFAVVKDFAEPWPAARARLFAITPTGYTRIGPALRHGANWLARTGARRRLLLLLSDGKPMDYDRYEGAHGVADVRHAVREMHRLGVQPIALAIDPHSKRHLPAMFDRGAFAILPSAAQLPERLAKILHAVR